MRRSYLALAAVCTFWGTIPLVAERTGLPPAGIVLGRVWLAAAGLGAALVLTDSRRLSKSGLLGRRPAPLLVTGALLAAHWTAMFAGYERAPDDVVAFIVFLAPIGIALLAPRTLGERLGLRTVVALAAAVTGLLFVAGPSHDSSLDAAAGLALAAFSAATLVAIVLLAKPLSQELGGLRLTFLQMVIAGTALLPVAFTADWGDARWPWLLILGFVHTGIGTALYLTALSKVPATHVGILGYLEPVGVVLFGWLLADASPKLTTLAGGALIVAAGALVMTQQEETVRVPG